MRIDEKDGLPAGQWVEMHERITHAQDKEIRRARVLNQQDPVLHAGEPDTVAIRVFTKAWSVTDRDGAPIALEDADAIDRLPMDIADLVAAKARDLYIGTTVPNSPTPPSSEGSPSATE